MYQVIGTPGKEDLDALPSPIANIVKQFHPRRPVVRHPILLLFY